MTRDILRRMKTILVIDDERNIVELLRLYLEKEGWAVISAGDGETGLELHRRHEPDLIVLDLMLPASRRPGGLPGGPPARRHPDPHARRGQRDKSVDKAFELARTASPSRSTRGRFVQIDDRPAELRKHRRQPDSRSGPSGSSPPARGDRRQPAAGVARARIRPTHGANNPGILHTAISRCSRMCGDRVPGETGPRSTSTSPSSSQAGRRRTSVRDGPRCRLSAPAASPRTTPERGPGRRP